ncbi:MAG: transcriptional regulator [Flavobacteriales bacterium]|nr:transcriptional regulator [Flavobacteriales bacterium]
MDYKQAREEFIQAWGSLGSSWGINHTMAQIHALLMISPDAMTTDEVMEQLGISRGNANMNLRALIGWGIVRKESRPGDRKEYFSAEKDVWVLATQVAQERKKRELDPVLRMLNQVKAIPENKKSKEITTFKKVTADLSDFAGKMDMTLGTFVKAEQNWFFGKLLKMFK